MTDDFSPPSISLMPTEALIFDCDGTLTDSMPVHFVAWRATLQRHGIVFEEDRFYELAGTPTSKIIEMLAEEQGVSVDVAEVTKQKAEGFIESIHLVKSIPQVAEVVREHRGRMKMAVASGGLRRVVEIQLRQIGMEGWFDAVVTAEDTIRHKPEPDVFLEAARRLEVPAENCLVYEDSDFGLEAARRAGMQRIDIRQFHQPKRVTG